MMMDNNTFKRFEQSRDCEKSLQKNEQEVLVLPPNLLQELGINLGNIHNTPDCPIVKDDIESRDLQNEETTNTKFEPIDNVAKDVIANVFEKSTHLNEHNLPSIDILQQESNFANNVTWTKIEQNNINILENHLEKNTDGQIQYSLENNTDIVKTHKNINECNNKDIQCFKVDEFDDSNPNSSDLNFDDDKKSKINIISQEVVAVETFSKFKFFPTAKNALIPFELNTPLEKVQKNAPISNNILMRNSKLSNSLEYELDSNKKFKAEELVCDIDIEDNNFVDQNTNIYTNNSGTNMAVIVKTSEKNPYNELGFSDKNISNRVNQAGEKSEIDCAIDEGNREKSDLLKCNENKMIQMHYKNIDTMDLDKNVNTSSSSHGLVSEVSGNDTDLHIIEIKVYDEDIQSCREKNNNLSERLEESKSGDRYIDVSKHNKAKNLDHMSQGLLEKVNSSPQHLTNKSKLCIQGVEKPGGLIETNEFPTVSMPVRTYKNQKNLRIRNNVHAEILTNELNAENNDIKDYSDVNNLNVTCIIEQFCVCKDFGRLQFYDCENDYQHMHFWMKNTEQGSTVMSKIFSDEHTDSATDNYGDSDIKENNELSNICCMEYLTSESDTFEQINENKLRLSSETCINKNNKSMNINNIDSTDEVKSYESYSHQPRVKVEVEIFDKDKSCEQIIPNKKIDVAGTAKNIYRRISTVDEDGENSDKNKTKKRKRTLTEEDNVTFRHSIKESDSPSSKKIISSIKCAVCLKELPDVDWESHLADKHCYIAWKYGSNIDLKDEKLLQNLNKMIKKGKPLECTFCAKKEKLLPKFISHLKICLSKIFNNYNIDLSEDDIKTENEDTIMCEMCDEAIPTSLWTEHVTTRHNDNSQVILPALIKTVVERSMETNTKLNTETDNVIEKQEITSDVVKCAVCEVEMESIDWLDHIRKEHNYLAWKVGDLELNLDDERDILDYLQNLAKEIGGLVCSKCGVVRHYAKRFVKHIATCDGTTANYIDSLVDNQSDTINQTYDDETESISLIHTSAVVCGVCLQEVVGTEWLDHIHKEHNYLAKIRGVPPLNLDDEEAVRKHLHQVRLVTGYLACAKCGLKRKFIKSFLDHIKDCDGNAKSKQTKNVESDLDNTKDNSEDSQMTLQFIGTVKCAVCQDNVEGEQWLEHIQKEHTYIAWVEGMPPLNLQTDEEIWQYLNNLTKKIGGLVCGKCGLNRKYGKAYMQHVKECDGTRPNLNEQLSESQVIENNLISTYLDDSVLYCNDKVKCGVCAEEMPGKHWLKHIQKRHEYIAWTEGKPSLNQNDTDFIHTYLKLLIRRIGGLTCAKCGLVRKFAKAYLQHVKNCTGVKEKASGSQEEINKENEFIHVDTVRCGVCSQDVEGRQWIGHIRLKHDYLARIEGKPPLDINDEEEVRRHLNALRKYVDSLVCNNCGESRKFVKAYMKHVKHCDGEKQSDNGSDYLEHEEEAFLPTGIVQCGVCKKEVNGEEWIDHIRKEHDYLAWIEGRPPLNIDDEADVETHLKNVRQHVTQLFCNKCGQARKFVKSYMRHIRNCDGSEPVIESRRESVASEPTEDEDIQVAFSSTVTCGVCEKQVNGDQWVQHISTKHDYIAHVKGKPPLDIHNKKQIQKYLSTINKHAGGLICSKCGLVRLYVKSYLVHIKQCNNTSSPLTAIMNDTDEALNLNDTSLCNDKSHNASFSQFVYEGSATCAVCQNEVEGEDWIDHIQMEHNYLAWVQGQPPLDLDDQEQVHAHLYDLSKLQNGLKCKTCGTRRKYVKMFLDHIQNCTITLGHISEGNLLECAVCSEKVPVQGWKSHAMKNHYNIAWTVGSEPIDLKNPYAVERYLKEYKQVYKNLVCKICRLSRVSCPGFYAHILTCGKTDEEIEDYKSFCEICQSKYLCIYKNQHLAMHREQENAKEKKNRAPEFVEIKPKVDEGSSHGRRKAAERAKTVIEDYKSSLNNFKHKCPSCSFGTDVEEELEAHTCDWGSDHLTDSDVSLHLEGQSEDSDSDVDSDVSLEEAEKKAAEKKRRYTETSTKVPRMPFKINSANNYISQAAADLYHTHYTLEELFPDWKPRECQKVESKDLSKYLPKLEESCKVRVCDGEWTTYKRFEAKKDKVCSIFVGGSIRCVSWAPVRGGDARGEGAALPCASYLVVAGHRTPDVPRIPSSQLADHPALLQLWDFADFKSVPKFVLGLAHDYGTVWAMEWCPSGARDCPPPAEHDEHAEYAEYVGQAEHAVCNARLGLLAVACSNGSAYIFAVPYPTQNRNESQILKIKPSVELRLCSSEDRRRYQATAISWSKQKGHTVVLVGYADGSMAFYNLDCDSPFLRLVEDGVTILYPYQDDRPHNTCISDVGLFPSGDKEGAWGAWGGASCTGVQAALCAPAPRLHASLATAAAFFTPHWPSLIVTADEAIANHMTNELEWAGCGRRLGGQRALSACERCGAVAALTPPALRILRTHPAFRDSRRDVVGSIRMATLAKKRSKHSNDELSMKVEPLNYEDAIKEYGIELNLKSHSNMANPQTVMSEAKQQYPERFPLAEVPGLAFCSAPAAHTYLALPTHSGILFIIPT